MSHSSYQAVGLFCLACMAGCPSPTVYSARPTIPQVHGGSIAVRVLVPEPDVIVDVSVATVGARIAVDREERQSFQATVLSELNRAGIGAIEETDLPRAPNVLQLLEIRVDAIDVETDPRTGASVMCVIAGALTAMLLYAPCAGARRDVDVRYRVRSRLYSIPAVEFTESIQNGEPLMLANTARAPILSERTETYLVEAGVAMARSPSESEGTAWGRERGERMGQLVVADILREFTAALVP